MRFFYPKIFWALPVIISLVITINLFFIPKVLAENNSFVNIVMPIRGKEFWSSVKSPTESFKDKFDLVNQKKLKATWLLRFDSLAEQQITDILKGKNSNEVGLFLEITPELASAASVKYHPSQSWHLAESVLLTGYTPKEREALIDTYFEKYRSVFDYYPTAVGAWWIDGGSLYYMQQKYRIKANLVVADQFSTDDYQVWGLFFSTPYYPSRFNAVSPAQRIENKTGTVAIQWASRDPVNAYGERAEDSTYSVQANDYLRHAGLNISYFNKLMDIYLKQNSQPFGQITIGLENDFTENQYIEEFDKQLNEIKSRLNQGQIAVVTMTEFATWYKNQFPNLSAEKIISATDPLGTGDQVIWYLRNDYRAGIFKSSEGLILRDLRTYSDTSHEPCLEKNCSQLDLAHTESKQLDDITSKKHLYLTEGKISDLVFDLTPDGLMVRFTDVFNSKKEVLLTKNDIFIDHKPHTIQSLIIENTQDQNTKIKSYSGIANPEPRVDLMYSLKSLSMFILALIGLFFLPGRVLVHRLFTRVNIFEEVVMSTLLGLALFILISFLWGLINVMWMVLPTILVTSLLGLRYPLNTEGLPKLSWAEIITLILGVIISVLPVIRSGLLYPYGIGFWGPNGHDAIWHLSLVESLKFSLPPSNLVYAGEKLTNYHYFFDLVLAKLSLLPYLDPLSLYFRLWPLFISLFLGLSLWLLSNRLGFKQLSTMLVIGLFYTAGSWGYLVSFFRQRDLGGESMFWANQAISLHLNPPYALSILLILALLLVLAYNDKYKSESLAIIISATLSALLWGTKAYAGALILASLSLLAVAEIIKNKNALFLKISLVSVILSSAVYLLTNKNSVSLFEFSPLWLVHSMNDSTDRLNWVRLASARYNYNLGHNYFKLALAELLGVAIFLLGNLGIRIIGVFHLIRPKLSSDYNLNLLRSIGVLGIIPPLFFIQKGNPWNIVQFFYYTMFAATILSGNTLNYLLKKIPNTAVVLIATVVLVLAIPTTLSTLTHYFPNSAHSFLSNYEIDALSFLRKADKGVVLARPFQEKDQSLYISPKPLFAYTPSAYIPAFSGQESFISDQTNLEILGIDYKKRLAQANEFFKDPNLAKSKLFLKEASIKYIYFFDSEKLDLDKNFYRQIFENKEIKIYQPNLL